MRVAQGLYEGVELGEGAVGLITYMRTDSTRIAPEAIAEVRSYIAGKWGTSELPEKPNIYRTKKGAQDAHEAIRPASMSLAPHAVKPYLTPDQLKLYTLVWNRFVASQMKPSESTVTTVDITAGEYEFRATATRLDYKGYLAVYEELRQEEDDGTPEDRGANLPKKLEEGETLSLKTLTPSQHFTKPPARYTEAALVKELETLGIGRPSTYAQIIHTVLEREYVRREKSKLISTDLGSDVNRLLVHLFPDLFNVDFTANMEEDLDKVESGEDEWLHVVEGFYQPFEKSLERFAGQSRDLKKSMIEETDERCERCGKPMVIRWGRNGRFMACSGFPACKNTRNIKSYSLGVKCPVSGCDGIIKERRSKKGRVFYGCSRYPSCKFASWDKPAAVPCPSCGSPTVTEGKNGGYICPRCKHAFDGTPDTAAAEK
jgi:DNA topoisomerase-1